MIIWSNSGISTAAAASLSCRVSWMSAALGDGSPDGWLCRSLPTNSGRAFAAKFYTQNSVFWVWGIKIRSLCGEGGAPEGEPFPIANASLIGIGEMGFVIT